jgi:class 3 adenylate cyclase
VTADHSVPIGLFTILITDIEGSTKLAQAAAATLYAEAAADITRCYGR